MFLFLLALTLISPGFSYDTNDFNFAYFWSKKPQIVLCDDAKVTKKNLEHAISFWKHVGLDINTDIVEKTCTTEFAEGEIRITHQRDLHLEKYYGYTEMEIDGIVLHAALITIEDAFHRDLQLLVHELGHAFGIDHEIVDHSHIMHTLVMEEDTRWR